jgi:hypothetical protein
MLHKKFQTQLQKIATHDAKIQSKIGKLPRHAKLQDYSRYMADNLEEYTEAKLHNLRLSIKHNPDSEVAKNISVLGHSHFTLVQTKESELEHTYVNIQTKLDDCFSLIRFAGLTYHCERYIRDILSDISHNLYLLKINPSTVVTKQMVLLYMLIDVNETNIKKMDEQFSETIKMVLESYTGASRTYMVLGELYINNAYIIYNIKFKQSNIELDTYPHKEAIFQTTDSTLAADIESRGSSRVLKNQLRYLFSTKRDA